MIQSPRWCNHNLPGFHVFGELCAIDPPDFETGGCDRDSGGPLVVYHEVEEEEEGEGEEPVEVGVLVSGAEGCPTTRPTVFTKATLVEHWVDYWIRRIG